MTVSRALNNSDKINAGTKELVLKKAEELGYIPNQIAKSLQTKKTYTIGVVIPEIQHVFFSAVISGIESVVYDNNYHLFLTNSSESFEREKDVIETLKSRRVDGLLISRSEDSDDEGYYKKLIDTGTQIVFFDRCVENIGASCICVNDYSSSFQATEHLINNGYKKIAHLAGPPNLNISSERLRGYKDALERNDLLFDDSLVVISGFKESGGYKAMNELMSNSAHLPEAIVAVNDPAAFGAIKFINESGYRIPDDIAIVGFSDDIRSELLPVPLTTVKQPAYEMGERAARKLISTIENKSESIENIYMSTELIIRASSGTARSI
ncbi:MAG: LacI family transcriptional regulator [Balneola sp.]|nr:MAG: LacI family transcriptional regulator [Balneola sp.]